MRIGRWRVWTEFGVFPGNPPAGFLFKVGEIAEDWPKGWATVTILGIQIGKFSIGFGIGKS